jgi:hypothetical protein
MIDLKVLVVQLLFVLISCYGYINNVINILQADFEPLTTQVLLGLGGIFVPPIGAVMGLFVW